MEQKQKCRYWDQCYRQNGDHLNKYLHPRDVATGGTSSSSSSKDAPPQKAGPQNPLGDRDSPKNSPGLKCKIVSNNSPQNVKRSRSAGETLTLKIINVQKLFFLLVNHQNLNLC